MRRARHPSSDQLSRSPAGARSVFRARSPGEQSAHLPAATTPRVCRTADPLGLIRRTLVVALGGGTICDAATLAAATYMRGLPCALVPTTLIAQADAAIGGKGG